MLKSAPVKPGVRRLMKEGVGKKEGIPDNQKFNEQKLLKKPRIFAIEKKQEVRNTLILQFKY